MPRFLKAGIAFLIVTVIWTYIFWSVQTTPVKEIPTPRQYFLAGTIAQFNYEKFNGKVPTLITDMEMDSLALSMRIK